MKKYTEEQAHEEYNNLMNIISKHIEQAKQIKLSKARFAISIQTTRAIDLLIQSIDISNRVDIAYDIITNTTIMILQYNL